MKLRYGILVSGYKENKGSSAHLEMTYTCMVTVNEHFNNFVK